MVDVDRLYVQGLEPAIERASEQTRVPAAHIRLGASHTHSGPFLLGPIRGRGDRRRAGRLRHRSTARLQRADRHCHRCHCRHHPRDHRARPREGQSGPGWRSSSSTQGSRWCGNSNDSKFNSSRQSKRSNRSKPRGWTRSRDRAWGAPDAAGRRTSGGTSISRSDRSPTSSAAGKRRYRTY